MDRELRQAAIKKKIGVTTLIKMKVLMGFSFLVKRLLSGEKSKSPA